MKIVTVIGARPQFVKAAAVSRIIRPKIDEKFIHTGQHYDANMSDVFFEEMSIPHPDYNLGVGSGSHAKQTAEMMVGIEKILLDEKPDYVMVYGDTNSTLAGALAAVKIHIPVIHVEAGLRSYNMRMPEEVNRILTDRISQILFCPTEMSVKMLSNEGIRSNVFMVGDVMCDAVKYYGTNTISRKSHFDILVPLFTERRYLDSWYMATIHRAENTDIDKISEILLAFECFDRQVIFPVHPRVKGIVKELYDKQHYENIYFTEPMGYTDMLFFTKNAVKTVTDSGGLQKEAYILGCPCVTIREQTEWVETLNGNFNLLCRPNKNDIIDKVENTIVDKTKHVNCYGDGHAAEKILNILENLHQ